MACPGVRTNSGALTPPSSPLPEGKESVPFLEDRIFFLRGDSNVALLHRRKIAAHLLLKNVETPSVGTVYRYEDLTEAFQAAVSQDCYLRVTSITTKLGIHS